MIDAIADPRYPATRALVDYLRRPDSCVRRERLARRLRLCLLRDPALIVVETVDDWHELLKL